MGSYGVFTVFVDFLLCFMDFFIVFTDFSSRGFAKANDATIGAIFECAR